MIIKYDVMRLISFIAIDQFLRISKMILNVLVAVHLKCAGYNSRPVSLSINSGPTSLPEHYQPHIRLN